MTTPFNVRSESWPRVSALLDLAYEMDAAARAQFLATVTADDAELGAELARLLPAIDASQTSIGTADSAPFTALLSEALALPAQQETPNSAGARFGAWTLVEKLGAGGMGEVWRALRSDGLFQGTAAIKLLRSDLPADRLAARFARERSVLARLNHPNIARLLDAGIANGQAFIVLELVEGEPLLRFAAEHTNTLAERVRLVRDIARAVEHAHSQLVLHRDLKPSNVLVTPGGTVKLLDFGIAAAIDDTSVDETSSNLTQLTGRGLTLEYAAPEQILGEPTVAASDVYSLGVMLFHLLTGQRPFAASANRTALEYSIVHDEAPRASAPVFPPGDGSSEARDAIAPATDSGQLRGDLDAIIAKALRKSAIERYATAAAFATDLDAWLTRSPISIRAEDRNYRARLWLRRNWALAGLGGVAATAVVIGLAVSLWQRSEAVAAALRATEAAALAKQEAARASKVADYLGELIQSASPDNHGGKWPTVIALLEQSEKDLDEKFKDDPKTKSLLLERLADTNNTLNRDTVSLAQYEQLLRGFEQTAELKTERAIDARKNYASMLKRLGRHEEALRQYETLKPLTVEYYGLRSEPYGTLLMNTAVQYANAGRVEEARALLAEGTELLRSLYPNDVAKRLDIVNDTAVVYTRLDLWREAEAALAANEKDFALLISLGGVSARDALIQRNNLEAMRIRLGKTDGTDQRLRVNSAAAIKLLGGPNPIARRSEQLRATLASSEGRFAESAQLVRTRAAANATQKGIDPAARIEDDLVVLRDTAIHTQLPRSGLTGGASTARAELERLMTAIATELPQPGEARSNAYRAAADTALAMGHIDLARDAVALARDDASRASVANRERLAQIERAAAALAFGTGEAKQAVALLEPRFKRHRETREDSTPRVATLWAQRALYECSFDTTAAAASAAQSRSIFAQSGGPPPQFGALLAYVDACFSGNKQAIRAAEDAVDTAYLRARPTPWRLPLLASL